MGILSARVGEIHVPDGESRMRGLRLILVVAVLGGCSVASGARAQTAAIRSTDPGTRASARPRATLPVAIGPTLAQLVGQKLVVRVDGVTASQDLLGRIRRGEVGGVILFGWNITTPEAVLTLSRTLRAAATAGGQPPLLVAVDQEGGTVRRIPWAPPTMSAAQMGVDGRVSTARSQGAATGAALAALGIDVDLAPVADVPVSAESFMALAGRTFSSDAATTTILADAFAAGLESRGMRATRKHFPGIGLATQDTDAHVVSIAASRAALAPGIRPYQAAIADGIPLIMLSNATYPAYDPDDAAAWSHAIALTLLRRDLGFTGVTITDSLDGTAKARGLTASELAVRAADAGTDLLLTTGSDATSAAVFAAVLQAARAGVIPRSTLQASYDRIMASKAGP